MEYYRLILYFIFGVLPSITWLLYYLSKDLHPEPKKMILKIFIYGSLVTIPVFFIQISLAELLKQFQFSPFFIHFPIFIDLIKWFIIIALTEELFKYFVVKVAVFGSSALDEPLDIMLYMVVAALGFAALENILYLFSPLDGVPFNTVIKTTIIISFIRFIGATFLHTLCSAILGYFVVLSFCKAKKRLPLTLAGILAATFLHGLYNFSIIALKSPANFIIPIGIVLSLAVLVIYAFDEVKKLNSTCKLN
ncbi:MAG: hypothetical protein A3A98_03760 [Candidatus Staskawiczbacteria bacterium RIFCSPLOWO2_01_FULL_40_39]|uniref:Protease PrsW n=1 Tax=Candidatus Staskawiczbacteria bacterium RIFCSPHIGHO2_01_FULL_39_25 TaxID=1802202 RepID=A0A1G2HND5_9BACT|nr:MAG: hypothetical protein A2730_02975 [Candidatus Staskawiczbacteria bacterium RIFCSPHIGHO2_01_FULL_39_25]OGZ73527.1 MAG: hypothetical protein A3A98_03760 [Candidatus Staskawiczbacteria bacterium RIFCSPLOWO2_01_FULL_40_39]OGZ75414.1 MAG: hypothetical protein A3I87_03160 [Candidatus Staskawiczbacteria bacterium RIFCSPLOWO2_02_FULL_39_8]